jgi:molecular chaperone DnaK
MIRTAMEKLATESQALGQALYQASGAAAGAGGATDASGASSGPSGGAHDDVVDAEIVDEEPRSGKK